MSAYLFWEHTLVPRYLQPSLFTNLGIYEGILQRLRGDFREFFRFFGKNFQSISLFVDFSYLIWRRSHFSWRNKLQQLIWLLLVPNFAIFSNFFTIYEFVIYEELRSHPIVNSEGPVYLASLGIRFLSITRHSSASLCII